MFYVVQLDSDVLKEKIVVPSVWLDISNTLCLLPPTHDAAEIEELAKSQSSPKHGWIMHNIAFIQSFDTYSQAEENISKNKSKPITVELEEEEEEGKRRTKKRKCQSLLINYSENDDEGERCNAMSGFCFVKDNSSLIDTSIVKEEITYNSSTSEPKSLCQDAAKNSPSSNCIVIHESNLIMGETNSTNVIPGSVSMKTKCPCNSTCHNLMFQSIAELQKQVEDSNRMLCQTMIQLRTSVSILNTPPGSPMHFPVSLPVKELKELQTLNIYLSNQRNFLESIPYFTTFGGSQPRQILKRIMEALLSRDLSVKLNWRGRGDKSPFNTYTKVHSFVHHIAKQNPRATHITLTEVENFMKDWLKVAPMKLSKSCQKKDIHQE